MRKHRLSALEIGSLYTCATWKYKMDEVRLETETGTDAEEKDGIDEV